MIDKLFILISYELLSDLYIVSLIIPFHSSLLESEITRLK